MVAESTVVFRCSPVKPTTILRVQFSVVYYSRPVNICLFNLRGNRVFFRGVVSNINNDRSYIRESKRCCCCVINCKDISVKARARWDSQGYYFTLEYSTGRKSNGKGRNIIRYSLPALIPREYLPPPLLFRLRKCNLITASYLVMH